MNTPPVKVLSAITGLVALTGTISNSLSLSFYIKQSGTNLYAERQNVAVSLTRHLFMALNSFDLALCVFVFLCSARGAVDQDIMKVCYVICMLAEQSSGFITCLLAVTRAISLWKPFYVLHSRTVYIAVTCFSVAMFILALLSFVVDEEAKTLVKKVFLFTLASVFIVVVFSNVLSISNLLLNSRHKDCEIRHATITVAILSVAYCLFNIGFLVSLGQDSYPHKRLHISDLIQQINVFILLPLNSACNPIVYFIRMAEKRKYVLGLWKRLTGICVRGQKTNNPLNVINQRKENSVKEEATTLSQSNYIRSCYEHNLEHISCK